MIRTNNQQTYWQCPWNSGNKFTSSYFSQTYEFPDDFTTSLMHPTFEYISCGFTFILLEQNAVRKVGLIQLKIMIISCNHLKNKMLDLTLSVFQFAKKKTRIYSRASWRGISSHIKTKNKTKQKTKSNT